ncbi:MAG: MotA/TolQ/ExbB proton channel family protein [Kiritimatiellae bacterium]|jgi:biopolymer transport protein ExbB|nr:MotA/TolQ/ExbB proton channel family protein [Kiritimatiellia bacterium]
MKKKLFSLISLLLIAFVLFAPAVCLAQEEGGDAGTLDVSQVEEEDASSTSGLGAILFGSGWVGTVLWAALIGDSIAALWLIIDFSITISAKRITPPDFVASVKEAMDAGDVMRAIELCEANPGCFSSILMAGFRNVKEGFEVIEEQVSAAADLESEKLMQRVSYLNLCGSIGPSLGLLGTVQGMIMAFANLANTTAGAAQQALLALNISQALWTTAAGLIVSIPAISFYTYFKNRLSRIILKMEGDTVDLIKTLRNVEVVEE